MNFFTVKETTNTTKRQPTELEWIFTNDISDKQHHIYIYINVTATQQPKNK